MPSPASLRKSPPDARYSAQHLTFVQQGRELEITHAGVTLTLCDNCYAYMRAKIYGPGTPGRDSEQ